jgi:hypothetical protein
MPERVNAREARNQSGLRSIEVMIAIRRLLQEDDFFRPETIQMTIDEA